MSTKAAPDIPHLSAYLVALTAEGDSTLPMVGETLQCICGPCEGCGSFELSILEVGDVGIRALCVAGDECKEVTYFLFGELINANASGEEDSSED